MAIYKHEIEIPRPKWLNGVDGHWKLEGLTDVTVLLGRNSSGKSLLLRSWRDGQIEDTHYVVPERTGDITFEPGQLQQQQNPKGRKSQSQHNSSPSYHQQVVTRITTYFAKRGAFKRNEAVPERGAPDDLEKFIQLLIPDFDIKLSADAPPYELNRLPNYEKVGGVNELSSGEAQILTIGLDIITIAAIWDFEHKDNRIILIDEPDAHIHPDLQTRFADFILKVIDEFKLQVIVATHSTTLLAALGQLGNNKASVIYLDRTRQDFRAYPLDKERKELAVCLGGHALMGPLCGSPLLLVEGDDDFRIWSQVPRHHIINLSVIPSNGDEIFKYQKSLEQIFASLVNPPSKPLAYALLDGDKSLPQPNPDNLQKYVQFIKMNCHEAENLYLTDEVLADLELTWGEASQEIKNTDTKQYGEKAGQIDEIPGCDRKAHDLKNIIDELSKMLDKKNVLWTVRVGQRIGKERPNGQLADFLGEDVVNALWQSIESESSKDVPDEG